MNRVLKTLTVATLLTLFLWCPVSIATVIFDNGPVDPTRTTWNHTFSGATIYDDFVLDSLTTITGLNYSIFVTDSSNYVQTHVSIYDGIDVGASAIIPVFTAIGTLTSNGLTTGNPIVPFGFDVAIDSLSMTLAAGTYFLGFSTEGTSGSFLSIGSGPGSAQTIGPGGFVAFGTSPAAGGGALDNDHIAFQIISGSEPIPEPTTIALLGIGLIGLAGAAIRRKLKAKNEKL